MDCIDFLNMLPKGEADIFTDPPYNVGKDYGIYKDNRQEENYKDWIKSVLLLCKEKAGTLTVYTPHKWQHFYWQVLGPEFRQIILYHRAKNGFYYGFVNKIAVLLTNALPEKKEQVPNIWEGVNLPGIGYFSKEKKNEHPGYTTEEVTLKAVKMLCKNEIIADPFMGSGTTALAALMSGKKYVGAELNPDYIKAAKQRVSSLNSYQPEIWD